MLDSLARKHSPNTWAVITDLDETVLDNSEVQDQLLADLSRSEFTSVWRAWVQRRAARALPGVTEFVHRVHALGGRYIAITNRDQVECEDTKANLKAIGVSADAVLCRPEGGTSDKNPRFRAVELGGATTGLAPLTVVMWLGDSIEDFPDLTQSLLSNAPDSAFMNFGSRFIMLPNPMYGSWVARH